MYDRLTTLTLDLGSQAIGAGTVTRDISLPVGTRLVRVLEINVRPTVTFTNVTTAARIDVGSATSPAALASLPLAATAAAPTLILGIRDFPATTRGVYVAGGALGTLTAVRVTMVAATGGTPAGTADVSITLGVDLIGQPQAPAVVQG